MSRLDLREAAARLPQAWTSAVVARFGAVNMKVVRMDGAAYPEERHDYDEGLLVLEGSMNLVVEGTPVEVRAGEIYVVPAGKGHHVAPGSTGTLVILDV